MPNYRVTEYDTIISTYKLNTTNKQDAINKIAKGDLTTKATYRANGYKNERDRKKYRAREIINGKKKIQVIAEETQNQKTTTNPLL